MPFRFNMLLEEAGIAPKQVRLLRHHPKVAGKSMLDIWRVDPHLFGDYQAVQLAARRSYFTGNYWASFIGTWDGRTIFAGLYAVGDPETIMEETKSPISDHLHAAGELDRFPTSRTEALAEYAGKLYIEWGGGASGKRSWAQRADLQDKLITELHLDHTEAPFPGLMTLTTPLSELGAAPPSWIQRLSAAKGVYLLTCPATGVRYVGSAIGEGGFWSRWESYRANGHGGNIGMIDLDKTDWIASVLQVAGSADADLDILAMEDAWKRKIQSREFGLNHN